MSESIQSVSVVGAGNVAGHLGAALKENGVKVNTVYSRNAASAKAFADKLHCDAIPDLRFLPEKDLVLVCVSDDAIASVLEQILPFYKVAYTSGSVALDSLPKRDDLGVFYPLQTFSKDRKINLFETPFLIEATNETFAQQLFDLAWKLSRKVKFASSEDRRHLHLGAVLVNNFTNHLALLAQQHVEANGLDWELLYPLMQETIAKLKDFSPLDAQTGPARRNDLRTMEKHISMLDGLPKEIYELISRSIRQTYNSGK